MNDKRQHLIDAAVEDLRQVACFKAVNGEWLDDDVREILACLIDACLIDALPATGWQSDTPRLLRQSDTP